MHSSILHYVDTEALEPGDGGTTVSVSSSSRACISSSDCPLCTTATNLENSAESAGAQLPIVKNVDAIRIDFPYIDPKGSAFPNYPLPQVQPLHNRGRMCADASKTLSIRLTMIERHSAMVSCRQRFFIHSHFFVHCLRCLKYMVTTLATRNNNANEMTTVTTMSAIGGFESEEAFYAYKSFPYFHPRPARSSQPTQLSSLAV